MHAPGTCASEQMLGKNRAVTTSLVQCSCCLSTRRSDGTWCCLAAKLDIINTSSRTNSISTQHIACMMITSSKHLGRHAVSPIQLSCTIHLNEPKHYMHVSLACRLVSCLSKIRICPVCTGAKGYGGRLLVPCIPSPLSPLWSASHGSAMDETQQLPHALRTNIGLHGDEPYCMNTRMVVRTLQEPQFFFSTGIGQWQTGTKSREKKRG